MIHKHEFKTLDGTKASVELKNAWIHDIRGDVLTDRFAGREHADHIARANFCLFVSHVVSVNGIDWEPVGETATEEQFTACYHGFAELVDAGTGYECALAVVQMGQRVDALEKPDQALTASEQADPNS